jgi:hypothetical protein
VLERGDVGARGDRRRRDGVVGAVPRDESYECA